MTTANTVPTIVIAVTEPKWISQLFKAYSAPVVYRGYRVILHGSPVVYHTDYGPSPANYDVLIDSDLKLWYANKAEQSAYLHSMGVPVPRFTGEFPIDSKQQSLFIDINGYFSKMWNSPDPAKSKYLLKSTTGARGIGQFLINGDIPLIKVLAAIKKYSGAHFSEYLEETFGDTVVYNTQGEWSTDEGLKAMPSSYLQEYIDIYEEYRIVTDKNGLVDYIQSRDRVGGVYKQAVGSNALDKIDRTEVNPRWDSVRAFIRDKVVGNGVVLPFRSMDVALTKDGKFYLLEYSSQYGIEGIPDEVSYQLARKYLEHQVDEYLSPLPVVQARTRTTSM